jgi:hypothetical protein
MRILVASGLHFDFCPLQITEILSDSIKFEVVYTLTKLLIRGETLLNKEIKMRKAVFLVSAVLIVAFSSSIYAGISLRVGAALPQGDFKDYAGNGWSADVVADLHPFSVPFLSMPALVNYSGYGNKKTDWSQSGHVYTQESKITITGGGLGLKVEPPALPLRPFGEVLGRLASLEQDYFSGISGAEHVIESQTKFGVQFTGGLNYPLVPSMDLQGGVSYTTFFNLKMSKNEEIQKFTANIVAVFVGITFNFGW